MASALPEQPQQGFNLKGYSKKHKWTYVCRLRREELEVGG